MGHGFRIRTISLFTPALPSDEEGWRAEIEAAAAFLKQSQALYGRHGAQFQHPERQNGKPRNRIKPGWKPCLRHPIVSPTQRCLMVLNSM